MLEEQDLQKLGFSFEPDADMNSGGIETNLSYWWLETKHYSVRVTDLSDLGEWLVILKDYKEEGIYLQIADYKQAKTLIEILNN